MARDGDFTTVTKKATFQRQGGVCAFCGISLSQGEYEGHAHHLRPLILGGDASLDNCVYLCRAHHLFLGHGMAPLGIDKQGGSSDTWVQLEQEDLPYWAVEGS